MSARTLVAACGLRLFGGAAAASPASGWREK
jgi:hypothetical protein